MRKRFFAHPQKPYLPIVYILCRTVEQHVQTGCAKKHKENDEVKSDPHLDLLERRLLHRGGFDFHNARFFVYLK